MGRMGTTTSNETCLENIKKNVKDKVYEKIEKLGCFRKYNVVYGFDHACFYFIQFEKILNNLDFDAEQIVDIDTVFDGLTGNEFSNIIKKILPENSVRVSHCTLASLDMEF